MTSVVIEDGWGNTGEPAPWGDGEPPCQACGRRVPKRFAVACGECWHAWRFGWVLSLHDMWAGRRARATLRDDWGTPAPWWRLDRQVQRFRIRRPSKVWVCPCCAHDL